MCVSRDRGRECEICYNTELSHNKFLAAKHRLLCKIRTNKIYAAPSINV